LRLPALRVNCRLQLSNSSTVVGTEWQADLLCIHHYQMVQDYF
jgi:hypothetical protein